MQTHFLLFILLLPVLACKKEIAQPAEWLETEDRCNYLSPIWYSPLHQDTLDRLSQQALIYNDNVLFTAWEIFGEPQVLRMLNKETGALVWEWSDYLVDTYAAENYGVRHKDNILYHNVRQEIYAINLDNGQTEWVYVFPSGIGEPRIHIEGDYLYQVHSKDYAGNIGSHLARAKIPTHKLEWDTIYSIYPERRYSPTAEPPAIWVSPSEDTILLVKESFFNFENFRSYFALSAFNMTQDSLEWRHDSLDTATPVFRPLIYDDLVIFSGYLQIFCMDIQSGELVWRREMSPGQTMATSNLQILENRLLVNCDNKNLYALEPTTGDVIWHNREGGYNCNEMALHNGQLYYTCLSEEHIWVADFETGKHRPKECPVFDRNLKLSNLTIDEEQNRLYVADPYFGMAIDLE